LVGAAGERAGQKSNEFCRTHLARRHRELAVTDRAITSDVAEMEPKTSSGRVRLPEQSSPQPARSQRSRRIARICTTRSTSGRAPHWSRARILARARVQDTCELGKRHSGGRLTEARLRLPESALLESPTALTGTVPRLIRVGNEELSTRTLQGPSRGEIFQQHHRERRNQGTAYPIEPDTSIPPKRSGNTCRRCESVYHRRPPARHMREAGRS
jgi:hypothetical protein